MNDFHLKAASERAKQVAARADRPSRRRCSEIVESRGFVKVAANLDLRASAGDAGGLDFHGVASVTEHAYEMWDFFGPFTEIVSAGAFEQTLKRADLDVPLVLSHDSLRRIARTTNGTLILAESDDGLDVQAPGLDELDADVAYIAPKIRSGLIDEMSFAFRIDLGMWSPDYTEYRIERVDIHRGDVSIVGYGANPATSAELRQDKPAHDVRSHLLELALADQRTA